MVSKADCLKVLQKYVRSINVELVSFKEQPISEDLEGFLGEHFKLITKYKHENVEKENTFFVKCKPTGNQVQIEIVDELEVYNKEIFIYDKLLRQFEELEYDITFAPKFYYCNPTTDTLFMEDISLKGFSICDRREFFSVEQLKCVLKCLAMYHAGGFALERTKSKELGRKFYLSEEYNNLNEIFFMHYINKNSYSMKWWIGLFKTIEVLMDHLPRDSIYKSNLRKMINNYEFGKCFVTKTNINKTCTHGDLWSNNMLFKYENNSAVDCRLVDFQFSRYFYPCFDVLLAILCNTDAKTRQNHLEELYEYYYYTLAAYLEKYGYDVEEIHPKRDFYKSINLVKVEAVMQMLLVDVIIYLPKDIVTEYSKNESGIIEIMFENEVLVTEVFKTDKFYRKNVIEGIDEFRNALLNKFSEKI